MINFIKTIGAPKNMHVQSIQLKVSLTGRYATALHKEATAQKSIEKILQNINSFNDLLKNYADLEHILISQLLRTNKAISMAEEIGRVMDFSELFIEFLKVVITNRRFNLIRSIFNDLFALVDNDSNIVPVRIEAATTNKKHKKLIEDLICNTNPTQSYRFEHNQTPELLGGFRAFIREHCLDYSLRSRLNRLSYQLKEA